MQRSKSNLDYLNYATLGDFWVEFRRFIKKWILSSIFVLILGALIKFLMGIFSFEFPKVGADWPKWISISVTISFVMWAQRGQELKFLGFPIWLGIVFTIAIFPLVYIMTNYVWYVRFPYLIGAALFLQGLDDLGERGRERCPGKEEADEVAT